MIDFLFAGHTPWFTVPAVIGTIFFSIRLFLLLVGSDTDGIDFDADAGGDVADHHADSDQTFKVLSIQSIAAFLMGFGWAGLGGFRGSNWSVPESIGIGIVGGIAMVWLLGWLLKLVYGLQSSGNINIDTLPGRTADVYISIPARNDEHARTGRVRVVVDNRQRFYAAISTGPEIHRNARVKVVEISGDRTLLVKPLDPMPAPQPNA